MEVLKVRELPDIHYGPGPDELERAFERKWIELMTPDCDGMDWEERRSLAWERADTRQSLAPMAQ